MNKKASTNTLHKHWQRLAKELDLSLPEQLGICFLNGGMLSISTSKAPRDLQRHVKRANLFAAVNKQAKPTANPQIAQTILTAACSLRPGLIAELHGANGQPSNVWDLNNATSTLIAPKLTETIEAFQRLTTAIGQHLLQAEVKTIENAYRQGFLFLKHQIDRDPKRTKNVYQLLRAFLPPHLAALLHLGDYVLSKNASLLQMRALSHITAQLLVDTPEQLRDAVWNWHQMMYYEPNTNNTRVRPQFYADFHTIGDYGNYGFVMVENIPADVHQSAAKALEQYRPEFSKPTLAEAALDNVNQRMANIHGFEDMHQDNPIALLTGSALLFCESSMQSLSIRLEEPAMA
ncbi:hypothetical protein IC617_08125 [Neiella sp. HB171785]|uniref:Uncharacterized protein n=1 Tax=Neiella litorisoli TaxID=2771431 RepID=A0A8J6QH15_9GAMM|nr:hypothetical protein [Neiella litorisoli]MBD1389390.1 hypothetical protein [Neiella litorisoli]